MSRELIKLSMVLAASAATLSTPVAAQRLPVPVGRWNVDYGDIRCSLSRRIGGPQSPVLTLSSYLGEDKPELILIRDGSEEPPELPSQVDVVLLPSNATVRAPARSRRVQAGTVIGIAELGEGFIERFGAASGIRILARGHVMLEMATPAAAEGVAALKACNEDLLRSWGIDPTIQVSREAKLISGTITDADYPPEAVRNEISGRTVARFTVGADGRVTSCNIAVSSGSEILDRQSCGAIQLRFRYQPALDMQGHPVASVRVFTVRWMLPG